jgi:phosphatidylglycerophosphatase A
VVPGHNTEKPHGQNRESHALLQQQFRWGHDLALHLATGFGIGRLPLAPGTFGTLLGIPLYLLLCGLAPVLYVLAVVALFVVGVGICEVAGRRLGDDHGSIVWDEIVGYLVALYAAPPGAVWLAVGFVLFRVFDIWKPFPIRRLERRLHGGFGCMADDVVAGAYALVILQLIARVLPSDVA